MIHSGKKEPNGIIPEQQEKNRPALRGPVSCITLPRFNSFYQTIPFVRIGKIKLSGKNFSPFKIP